jgi:hypothetical protein
MSDWKHVLAALSSRGSFVAEWQLHSGVTFFMYIPSVTDLGADTLHRGSATRYCERERITIRHQQKLGRQTADNNVLLCSQLLAAVPGIEVKENEDGITVSLSQSSAQ